MNRMSAAIIITSILVGVATFLIAFKS